MKTVLIVDDHPLAVVAMKFLLENEDYEVVGTCDNGLAVENAVETLQPGIVVIDVDIPGQNGIEVVQALRKKRCSSIIVVISGKSSEFYSARSREANANAFVSKKNNLSALTEAIKAAEGGYSYFPFMLVAGDESEAISESKKLATLSAQEFRVFRFIVQGLSNLEIAAEMGVSNKTISTYKVRVQEKLGCRTQVEMYDFAHRNNME